MPDPLSTGIIAAAGAIATKDTINKIFGPTAEYLGEGLKNLTEKRINNLKSIFARTSQIIEPDTEASKAVAPRVLKSVISEASFYDDPVQQAYVAGIIARSRTEDGKDDRGTRMLKIIDRLSVFQLRLHNIAYSTFITHFSHMNDLGLQDNLQRIAVLFEYEPLISEILKGIKVESDEIFNVFVDSFIGLESDDLISDKYLFGHISDIQERQFKSKYLTQLVKDGELNFSTGNVFYCSPSSAGIQLFLWGHGIHDFSPSNFTKIPHSRLQIEGYELPTSHIPDREPLND